MIEPVNNRYPGHDVSVFDWRTSPSSTAPAALPPARNAAPSTASLRARCAALPFGLLDDVGEQHSDVGGRVSDEISVHVDPITGGLGTASTLDVGCAAVHSRTHVAGC